ncbi:MAG: MucR family transcriptional regulator [Paracoccaceae bacterium]|jgi:predicted transcriptional regulator|nr:MucR family transcriptional regulator [Paracoccaceae bacterium]
MTKSDPKLDLLAAVAASYASRADVSADDIVALVAKLRREFGESDPIAAVEELQPRAPGRVEPALSIDKAVTHDKVFCLCCGKGFKMLKRHLGAEHGLTEAAYRAMFGLSEDIPLVAPSYSNRKANYARKVGFGKYDRGETVAGRSASEENQSIS